MIFSTDFEQLGVTLAVTGIGICYILIRFENCVSCRHSRASGNPDKSRKMQNMTSINPLKIREPLKM